MPKPHERLAEAMNARRLELRLRWNIVASRASISPEALRSIRRGDYRPSSLTAQALDDVFRWESGSVEAILDGGEPTPLKVPPAPPDPGDEELSPFERRILRQMAELRADLDELRADRRGETTSRAEDDDGREPRAENG